MTTHPISTTGKCPTCGSLKFASAPGVWRRAICLACETIFIRLTGCEAMRHRAEPPPSP